jgi:hypothetical protein
MQMKALEERVQEILTKDYRGMAQVILSRRQSGEESGQVSFLWLTFLRHKLTDITLHSYLRFESDSA